MIMHKPVATLHMATSGVHGTLTTGALNWCSRVFINCEVEVSAQVDKPEIIVDTERGRRVSAEDGKGIKGEEGVLASSAREGLGAIDSGIGL